MNLEYRSFSVDLVDPLETAGGRIDARDGFLVRLRDDGESGVGEATPLAGWTESLGECRRALDRAAEALDRGEPDVETVLAGFEGEPAARHGLALALADLRSTRAGEPLYRAIGGMDYVGRVPVNATVGDGSPEETELAARSAVDAGFDTLKLKVGSRSVEADVDRVRRAREAVGAEVAVRADANGAWTRSRAGTAVDAFADLSVELVEQPLPASDLDGHAALRDRGVGIGVDEGLPANGLDAVLEAEAADALVLKPMVLGGPDVAYEIGIWALECGVLPIVTTTIDAVVARTAAVHLAASFPETPASGLATGGMLESDLAADPAPVVDGEVVVPQGNGLGVSGAWTD